LPRFLDVSEDAHLAAVDSVEGALVTAMASVKAEYLVSGKLSPVTLENESFVVNSSGFPTDTDATADSDTCAELFTALVRAPAIAVADSVTMTSAAGIGGVDVAGTEWYAQADDEDGPPATCKYYYLGRGFLENNNYQLLTHTLLTGVITKSAVAAIGA
jgi:MSHA pilin protein MshB